MQIILTEEEFEKLKGSRKELEAEIKKSIQVALSAHQAKITGGLGRMFRDTGRGDSFVDTYRLREFLGSIKDIDWTATEESQRK